MQMAMRIRLGAYMLTTKLRLICASDEELWELAKLFSFPQMPVELVYEETKQAIEEHKATASEWIRDLVKESVFNKERER